MSALEFGLVTILWMVGASLIGLGITTVFPPFVVFGVVALLAGMFLLGFVAHSAGWMEADK